MVLLNCPNIVKNPLKLLIVDHYHKYDQNKNRMEYSEA